MADADITKREWWSKLVQAYEMVVYNRFIDLDGDATIVIVILVVIAVYMRMRSGRGAKEDSAKAQ